MIPVRVEASTTAHIVRDDLVLTDPAHPMADAYCPVCDRLLGQERIALVYVGTEPDSRDERKQFWTGAAVAVHGSCAAPATVTAAQREAAPRTSPDMVQMWRVVQRLSMAQVEALSAGGLRWRLTESDWESIRYRAVEVGVDAAGRPTLFTVPVEVVPDAPARWPELVLVVDRRV